MVTRNAPYHPDVSEEIRLLLRVTPSGAGLDAAELEELALQLRRDLLDLGGTRVEREASGPAPDGTRAIELVAAGIGFLVSGLSTVASAAQIAQFLQQWRSAHPRRRAVTISVEEAGAKAPSTGTRRSALLVANASYRDPALSQLRSPVHDTRALAEVLGESRLCGFDVDLLTDAEEPTIRRRVAAFFADRDPDDVLLLHFSCHGLKDQRGRLYLAAADTELRALSATGVPAAFIADQMSESASRRIVLILDCCYSGAFARGASVRGDRTVHIAEEFGSGTGRIVLTASSATEYAFEGDQLTPFEARPSVFTEALVSGLRSGGADLDGDGEITVDELYEYAFRRVREVQSGQEPRKWTFGMAGPLVLARSTRPATLPDDVRADIASERVVLRLEAVTALAGLLSGGKPGMRDAASAALADLRDNDDSVRVRTAAASALGEAISPPNIPEPAPIPAPVKEPVPAPAPAPVPAPAPIPPPIPPPAAPRQSGWLTVAGWLAIAGPLLWFLALVPDEDYITRRYVPDMDEAFFVPHLATFLLVLLVGALSLAVRRWRSVLCGCLVAIGPWMLHRAGYLLFEQHITNEQRVGWWLDFLAVLAIVAAGAFAVRGLLSETEQRVRVPRIVAMWTYLVVGFTALQATYTSTDPSVDILVCVAAVAVAGLALRWPRVMATAALTAFGLFALLHVDWTTDWSGRVFDEIDDDIVGVLAIAPLLVLGTAALVWFTSRRTRGATAIAVRALDESHRRLLAVAAWLTVAAVVLPLTEHARYWGAPDIDDMDDKLGFWLDFGHLPLLMVAAVAVLVRRSLRTAGLLLGVLSWAVADRLVLLAGGEELPGTESVAHLLVAGAVAGTAVVVAAQIRRLGVDVTQLWYAVPAAILGGAAGYVAYALNHDEGVRPLIVVMFAGLGAFVLAERSSGIGPAVLAGWASVALPLGVVWLVVSGTEDEPLLFTAIVVIQAALAGFLEWRSRKVEAHQ